MQAKVLCLYSCLQQVVSGAQMYPPRAWIDCLGQLQAGLPSAACRGVSVASIALSPQGALKSTAGVASGDNYKQ